MKLLATALLPAFAAVALASPSVKIDAGIVNGGKCKGGQDAVFYKAIPFAEPPVGDLRFMAPKPYKKSFPQGKLDATTSAATCIQFTDDFTPSKLNSTKLSSEDCLYLDVWTPANATKDSKLPVKVWVYGGSNSEGSISDPLYDGCNTANADSILVTVNYRVGPLGYTALNSAGIYGNQGIKDIVLGLEWVQDNIAAFGGDPKKVLLFGQSAGAANVYIVGSLPQASSLVNGVIAESGAGRPVTINETQQATGASYARTLKCSTNDKACMQSKSLAELRNAYKTDPFLQTGVGHYDDLSVGNPKTPGFHPYVDGDFIPQDPYKSGVNVPTVFGFTEKEATVFIAQWAITQLQKKIVPTPALYKDFLRKDFGKAAPLVEKYYKPSDFEAYARPLAASGKLTGYNTTSLAILLTMGQIVTDSTYRCPAWYGAVQTARKNIPSWTYEFKHSDSCAWLPTLSQQIISIFAGTHTAEIPYVFGNLDNRYLSNGASCNSTSAEYRLSEQMMDAWTAMAANADPSTRDFAWPQFEPSKNLSAAPGVTFENTSTAGKIDFFGCELWSRVNAILAADNSTSTGASPSASGGPASSSTPPLAENGAASILPSTGGVAALAVLLMSLV
ncbi:alpha/beta-hydrolase [Aspergillus steynii IBT 23096]|uniref:Carboxylic ester hydrolase n=1 Tax=Aspergillus steynii IBT 23096 TaxID=1392250 RepID=A0A2I2GDC0_9EURO|nr:alpha/beta-hydrolase [Aspergillus steynii IBT 23096]PLB50894.1 alpha/beta-hydrolase [Aspergillus steynii IBT 23096]